MNFERKKRILVVISDTGIAETLKIAKKLRKENQDVTILALSVKVEQALQKASFNYNTLRDFYISQLNNDLSRQWNQAARFVSQLGEQKLDGVHRFQEILSYDGISLWMLASQIFAITHMVRIVTEFEFAEYLFDSVKPHHIVLSSNTNSFLKNIFALATYKGISVSVVRSGGIKNYVRKCFIIRLKPLLKLGVELLVAYRAARENRLLKMCNKNIDTKEKRAVFINFFPPRLSSVVPVVKELEKNYSRPSLIMLHRRWSNISRVELDKNNISYRFFEGYFSWDIMRKAYRGQCLLKKRWKSVADKFYNAINYEGLPMGQAVKEFVGEYFPSRFMEIIRDIETVKVILEKEDPGIIVCTDDFGTAIRTFFQLSGKRQIPTLRLQYGTTVAPCLPDWDFRTWDKAALSGGEIMNLLIKEKDIDPESLVVTGQPRYDDFTPLDKKSREAISRLYGVNSTKRLILFTSAPYNELGFGSIEGILSKDEYYIWLYEIYHASQKVPNSQLIVKPHPNPRDRVRIHYEVLSKVGNQHTNIVIVDRNSNIKDLIGTCDVLVTWDSNSGLEAMLLGKPVVIVNLTGRRDIIPYVSEGAALGAYKADEIVACIKKALEDINVRKSLLEAQKAFVDKRIFRSEIKASYRVAELIENMIREKDIQ